MIEQREFRVEAGDVRPAGSWVYAWADVETGEIAYIGATAFEPELRAHIHMTHPDPRMGRVRAEVADAASRSFTVRAFRVPEDVDRSSAKAALQGLLGAESAVADDRAAEFAAQVLEFLHA